MKTPNFFNFRQIGSYVKNQVLKHFDIRFILSQSKPGSLVILDIDDTIGRVPQTIGLDGWFRARIQQYANEGHEPSQAVLYTIAIYNQVQLASTHMVPVDKNADIAGLIHELKAQGIKVIALTARNHALTDQTLLFLETLNVTFSDDVLKDGSFSLNGKLVEIKSGVIFANGNNKGHCLEHTQQQGYFVTDLRLYPSLTFVDDSDPNCHAVADSLTRLNITEYSIWHYIYAKMHLPFLEKDIVRSAVQEAHLLKYNVLLTDEEADQRSASSCRDFK